MISSIKSKIESLNLNYKKEMLILGVANFFLVVVLGLIIYFKPSIIFISGILIMICGFNYYYLNRYNQLLRKREFKLNLEFIEVFSYLRIYLYNDETVYAALKAINDFSSNLMKERIDNLLEEIDNDKSIKPFMNFASKFSNKTIEEVMISLYEIINSGNSDLYLNQFVKNFEDFKNRIEQNEEHKRIKYFETINMLSIVGSGLIIVVLALSVVSLLGEITNGF